jgi:hypothetical protein
MAIVNRLHHSVAAIFTAANKCNNLHLCNGECSGICNGREVAREESGQRRVTVQ